jgi:hypothetical protein
MTTTYAVTKNFLVRALITILPRRMRRIVYLASLTAIAVDSNVPERALMQKLNVLLDLSSTGDAALKLPIHVSKLIWANKQVFEKDIAVLSCAHANDDHHALQSAERIVAATPAWFEYGHPGDSIKDLMTLFSTDNHVFTPVEV